MHVKNSIILLTSAGTLFGNALAERFAQLGARIILTDKDHERLISVYEQSKTISNNIHYFYMDDYKPESIEALLNYIQNKFNQAPDILINHWPGTPLPSVTDDHPLEQFTQNLTDMISTLFSFGQMSAERMRQEDQEGVIINIMSSNDQHSIQGFESSASMISGMTQSWSKELTPFNIRVGAVLPSEKVQDNNSNMSIQLDELIRNTEYIVENEYFSGRTMSA
ncbi:SDR family oxidoreductase [Vibrio quintilis]|uniref:3-oxoacyl-[acyl-carrier-protein] reductase FabG n=1 Tax=Vibrio quintilis TaxID=1117707 RepID=A0A1M7YTG0_9VIBR|nr:SDR family oxidoreductase [Vibrio quintilis]SHO55930.1 3-oxoacyl-[acyl-carrier-protein] reductase FabG [Vibrio quintilis]